MSTMLAQRTRPRPKPGPAKLLVTSHEEFRLTEEKMQASFLNCSIEEEDLIDNMQPNLISVGLTDSYSSRLSSENRSVGDGLETSACPKSSLETAYQESVGLDSAPAQGNNGIHQQLHTITNLQPRHTSSNEIPEPTFHSSSNMCRAYTFEGPTSNTESKSKLSSSMHDISKIPSYPLVSKSSNFSSETIQSQSITTVASLPKSKDSGFPRSVSCLSLTSGKSYEHVQSKVKEYIKKIKEVNKTKRKLSYSNSPNIKTCSNQQNMICEESTPSHMLVPIINKLKDELEEKDRMLLKLQENYDTLLMKYAAAENRLDHFRVNSVGNSFNITPPDYKKPKASPNMLLLPNLCELQNKSFKSSVSRNYKPETFNQHTKVMELSQSTKLNASVSSKLEKEVQQMSSDSTYVLPDTPMNQVLAIDSHSDQIESDPFGYLADSESLSKDLTPSIGERKLPIEMLNFQQDNPYVKVKRWQESLPCLDLIEPSNYDQVNCRQKESEMLHHEKIEVIDQSLKNVNEYAILIPAEHHLHEELPSDLNSNKDMFVKCANTQLPFKVDSTESESSHRIPKYMQSTSLSNNLLNGVNNLRQDFSFSKPTSHVSESKDSLHEMHYVVQDELPCKSSNPNQSVGIPVYTPIDMETPLDLPNIKMNVTCSRPTATDIGLTYPVTSPVKKKINDSVMIPDNVPKLNVTCKYLPPLFTSYSKTNLPTVPAKLQPISKNLVPKSTDPTLPFYKHYFKEQVDSDSLCRKRMLGQRARLLLMEYLKNSNSLCCCVPMTTVRDTFSCSCKAQNIPQITTVTAESETCFKHKNVSLIQCLDEMNECAQKLRGKSEAILQVLSRQLKDS